MNKKILRIMALAALISGKAWASNFSIELGAYLNCNDSRSASYDFFQQLFSEVQSTTCTKNTRQISFPAGIGGHTGLYYRIAERYEIGLLVGFGRLLEFQAPKTNNLLSPLQMPIKMGLRYFFTEKNANLSVYFTGRFGILVLFDHLAEKSDQSINRVMGINTDSGIGIEFYNIQIEAFSFYQMSFSRSPVIYESMGISLGLGYIFRI